MSKMREFVFWNDKGQEEKTEQMSLTKAVKSIQTKFKDKIVGVEYISKKGQKISEGIELPWGRKKKLSR
jgi:hypothetical protein